jgi:hypothetical protein
MQTLPVHLIKTALLILFFALCAFAQDAPQFEVFAGYSLSNAGAAARHDFSGAQFNFKFNIRESVALMADVGGQYRSDPNRPAPSVSFLNFHDRYLHAYQALVGPEFTRRRNDSDFFVHTLAGLVHGVARPRGNNFAALGLGGGIVSHRRKPVGFRAQVDYVPNRGAGRTYHDIRFGMGIVLRKK